MAGAASFAKYTESDAPTSIEAIDEALETLRANAERWARTTIEERIGLLERVITDTHAVAHEWAHSAIEAKGLEEFSNGHGEELWMGPTLVVRNARLLKESLIELSKGRMPNPKGKVTQRADGQTVVQVFPAHPHEKVMFPRLTAEVWMKDGVTPDNLAAHQAAGYQPWENPEPMVTVVLGAGNVNSIGPMDVLYELFVKHRVVCLKMNPVNEHIDDHLEDGFKALIDEGFLRIVRGGPEVGQYLTTHDAVDAIHLTGSDKTYDAIVFGSGEEGARRKAADEPINDRIVTAELANVSPIIVVPGPWTDADLRYQARHIGGSLTNNAGFNCAATRIIVTHKEWNLREQFIDAIGETLDRTDRRHPYYPGARDRWEEFLAEHPEARVFGEAGEGHVPWTFIDGLSAAHPDDICFKVEPFNGTFSEVALEAPRDVATYIAEAVEFCNETLWGTLAATILVHPKSLKDPAVVEAMDQAVADLRYGAIGVNVWGTLVYAWGTTTWGAFPGHPRNDIQTGTGVVHNTYLYTDAEKSVVRGPWRAVPEWPWHTEQKAWGTASAVTEWEASPNIGDMLKVAKAGVL